MLDNYSPLIRVSFEKIQNRILETTGDQKVIDALYNVSKIYTVIRGWMEAIWNDRRPQNIKENIEAMRKAYLQTPTLISVLDQTENKVHTALNRHIEKFHPSYLK